MPHSTMRLVVLIAVLLAAAFGADPAATSAQADILLFDVDFSTPPHVVGQPPVIGGGPAPRNTISSIWFGTPMVVSSHGPLMDQPCAFDSFDGQGDQIALDMFDLPPGGICTLECRLAVTNLASGADFGILLDTPQVRTIRFASTGSVNAFVPGVFSGSIGTFTLGTIVDLRVVVDLGGNTWSIYLDGVLAYTGGFGGATQIERMRFSTPVTPSPPGASAGLDDIRVTAASVIGVESTSWSAVKALYR